jgi:hypothetical protein
LRNEVQNLQIVKRQYKQNLVTFWKLLVSLSERHEKKVLDIDNVLMGLGCRRAKSIAAGIED